MVTGWVFYIIIALVVILFLSNAIKIVQEYERGAVFRLGRFVGLRGPGLVILIPFIERIRRVDLRVITMDVPEQECMTVDNVTVRVDAVVYFRVVDAANAVLKVYDFVKATHLLAQTTLRNVVGQSELDELLAHRDRLNEKMQKIVDEGTDPWGIKVSMVETKEVQLPENMKRAMAAQAEAERDRRAKVVHAEGEYQAAEKLAQAAEVMSKQPASLQLRYMQTLTAIATERSNTIIFPLPMDLLAAFSSRGNPEKK
ncbi:MAG TPA: slipin family protein [Dehalococcoidia bacterium]|nr:slipin family protein [Dehalococcoidia bacterium]